jgi:hypothetical protein
MVVIDNNLKQINSTSAGSPLFNITILQHYESHLTSKLLAIYVCEGEIYIRTRGRRGRDRMVVGFTY